MNITRQVVTFDTADLEAESTFWAALLGGTVQADDDWRTVIVDGAERLAFQLVCAGRAAAQSRSDVGARQGFQVYADPSGHPFCLCWE